MHKFILFIFILSAQTLLAQTDAYELLKSQYDNYRKENKQDSALLIARKMNHLALSNEGDTSLKYAVSFRLIGNCFSSMKKNDSAIVFYKYSLDKLESQNRFVHLDYTNTLTLLGFLHRDMGNYSTAKIYFTRALENQKSIFSEMHAEYANSLSNLGILYIYMGNYDSAELFCKKVLDIRGQVLGKDHSDYARSLNNLGNLYFTIGNYQAAEATYRESVDIKKKSLGAGSPDYAGGINNLGGLYHKIGDYKLAEDYFKQAMNIYLETRGENDLGYASAVENLGFLYKSVRNFQKSEALLKKSIVIKERLLGVNNQPYVMGLHNLGSLYADMGLYQRAEPYFRQALEIEQNIFGEEHPIYAMSLHNLGSLYADMGLYQRAEPYFKQALDIQKKALGESHFDYICFEFNYALFLKKSNKTLQAFDIYKKNFKLRSQQIAANFEWLSENQKELFWKKESPFYEKFHSFASEHYSNYPDAVALSYNSALLVKSKMLEAKISTENYYREVDELREDLATRRRLLAKLESEGSAQKERLEKLRTEADSLDKRLTSSWTEYAQQKRNLTITWDQVQQNLDADEAAIEFVRFNNEDDSLYFYNALVLRKGDANPTLIPLCREKELKDIPFDPKRGFGAFYSLIWQPLEALLKGVKTIYYAPTGELNNLPFHAIVIPAAVIGSNTGGGVQYLMDRYILHQLTSTRYLAMGLKQKEKEPATPSLACIGGVDYDCIPGEKNLMVSKYGPVKRGVRGQTLKYFGPQPYLEGTKKESDLIQQICKINNWPIVVFEGNLATEENITKLEGKEAKTILHLATHGYAFPAFDYNDSSISSNSIRYSYYYNTNPMVRSGLMLAGSNWKWTGIDTLNKLGREDGILTALEVSNLNLRKTKLVVLSACQTGLGQIDGGEGTFGLKRAFKLAGVEQIIVSLWSVRDKETLELMTLFYRSLGKTQNPVISFENAQKEMRNRYPEDPEYWAGFVLIR